MKSSQEYPLIFDIRRGSLDDGPGIRTVIFLKGCWLNCMWCHNPESIDFSAEMAFYSERCIGCGLCKSVCRNGAINLASTERIERNRCICCGKCADACPTFAIKKIGKFYTVNELVENLMQDKDFYKVSGGGVTFSGGEPLIFMDYLGRVMEKLKKEEIHIAVQTSGFFDYYLLKQKVLKYIDLVFYDIKFIDPHLHKKYTGRDNKLILDNFLNILKEDSIQVIPRVPLIPGITDVEENLWAIADLVRTSGSADYSLLSYNTGGAYKRFTIQKAMPKDMHEYIFNERQWQ